MCIRVHFKFYVSAFNAYCMGWLRLSCKEGLSRTADWHVVPLKQLPLNVWLYENIQQSVCSPLIWHFWKHAHILHSYFDKPLHDLIHLQGFIWFSNTSAKQQVIRANHKQIQLSENHLNTEHSWFYWSRNDKWKTPSRPSKHDRAWGLSGRPQFRLLCETTLLITTHNAEVFCDLKCVFWRSSTSQSTPFYFIQLTLLPIFLRGKLL